MVLVERKKEIAERKGRNEKRQKKRNERRKRKKNVEGISRLSEKEK